MLIVLTGMKCLGLMLDEPVEDPFTSVFYFFFVFGVLSKFVSKVIAWTPDMILKLS